MVNLEGLQADIRRAAGRRVAGIFDHHPLDAAAAGNRERYFEPGEPYYAAWARWAWNPLEGSPQEFLDAWAECRFPGAAGKVAAAYRELLGVRDKLLFPTGLARGFFAPWLSYFDWAVLSPETCFEASYDALRSGPLAFAEAPYGYPPDGWSCRLFDENLRRTSLAENPAAWIDRFDATSPIRSAIANIEDAAAASPDDPHLPRLLLWLRGSLALAQVYRDYAEAGIRASVLGDENRPEVRILLQRALDAAYAYMSAPTSRNILWSRWGHKLTKMGWLRMLQHKLGLGADRKVIVPEPLVAPVMPSGVLLPLDVSAAANTASDWQFHDYPADFPDDPHVPVNPEPHRFDWLPRGSVEYGGVPFRLSGSYIALASKALPQLTGASGWIDGGGELSCFHLLAAAVWREAPGVPIGVLEIEYGDGGRAELPIRFWEEVTNYKFAEVTPSAAVPVILDEPGYHGHFTGQIRGINQFRLVNPRPWEAVKRIRLKSSGAQASLLVFAATAEAHPER
ncbi:MAG: hypothetical protein HY320_05120 [Armatimonadetes bacterium]|nr:hypothetical protein [Armatimonadota bacterium]